MPGSGFQQPEFMMPTSEVDASQLAFIHALRATADGMKRLGDQMDRQSKKIDSTSEVIHDIDKRLAVIEANSLSTTVKDIEDRVHNLEEQEQRRQGAIGLWDFVLKSWPAIVGFVLLVAAILIADGQTTIL